MSKVLLKGQQITAPLTKEQAATINPGFWATLARIEARIWADGGYQAGENKQAG